MKPRISFIINARNEADALPDLIRDIRGAADEIVLLDGRSTDGTREIAKKMGARVILRKEAQRTSEYPMNHYIILTKNDWIFNIDADERLTPQLKAALPALIADPRYRGYRFRRRNFMRKGHWLRYGAFYPDFQLRLFDRRRTFFPRPIHSFPRIRGAVKDTLLDMIHLKYLRPSARAEAQKAEWRAGEPEGERNPLARAFYFILAYGFFFWQDFIIRQGFREPGYLSYVWDGAVYFARHPFKIKEKLRLMLPGASGRAK